jgi:hypothetical protein
VDFGEKQPNADPFELLSPINSAEKTGIFDIFPSLSFASSASDDSTQELEEKDYGKKVLGLEKKLLRLKIALCIFSLISSLAT